MEFLVELVLQLLVELLTNLAGRPFRSRSSPPILIALGYGTLGAAVGLVSVIFWPTSASSPLALRLLTLILVPLLTGLVSRNIKYFALHKAVNRPVLRHGQPI